MIQTHAVQTYAVQTLTLYRHSHCVDTHTVQTRPTFFSILSGSLVFFFTAVLTCDAADSP